MKLTTVVTCLLLSSLMLLSLFTFNHQPLDAKINGEKDSRKPRDKLIGGLLTEDFDEESCLSRYHSSLYRKPSPYKPSQYLLSKLRSYEMLHKRCGPGTKAYKEATKNLGHDQNLNTSVGECRYIVWIAVYGLGNRILTLSSLFLYALLTERIILLDQRTDISHLFCEPFPEYSENLRTMYWEGPSSTGDMVQVYQPSQEMYQQTDKKLHDQKALAEIYLLSLTDKLVTSNSSTFGYVAQGLGGLRPWILYKPKNQTNPCVKAISMEPCFLRAPIYGCQAKTVKITRFVRPCEDRLTGLKLVDFANEVLL
ncbi:probable fucosyltransferase 8 isoform X3 [Brassica rapa]|uniref:probable fucosyltransferase 8 isoform X3 n=1 Tax=Brassica campestris TaxID=3711 RepID=UPI000872A744|nr:probable fucosyltransferase 8 isoform X3 [Brassica rapa]